MAFNDFESQDDLTAGLMPVADRKIKTAGVKNRLPLAIAKTAGSGFVDIGSSRFYYEGNAKLAGYAPGSFWKISEADGKQYLERVGVEKQVKKAANNLPKEFPTENELNEYAEENGYRVSYEMDMYILKDNNGQTATYEDLGSSLRQASIKTAEYPPRENDIPEGIQLDTKNKYDEIKQERELSESEESDLALITENLNKKKLGSKRQASLSSQITDCVNQGHDLKETIEELYEYTPAEIKKQWIKDGWNEPMDY